MGEWMFDVLKCAVDSLLWVGGKVYASVGGKELSVFLTGISLLVVFLLMCGVLDLIRKLLASWLTKANESKKAVEKPKDSKKFIEKLIVPVNLALKRLITLSKLSIAAAAFLITIAWVVSIYLHDIGIPTVKEFKVKESSVVAGSAPAPAQDSPTPESQAREALGQMGDFFGGMLNPILAFASFIALLYTIRIQSEQIRESKKSQELRDFESAFFSLIEALRATPKPSRERIGLMSGYRATYHGEVDPRRRSSDYWKYYSNTEQSILEFSAMFYECALFLKEHSATKPIHWTILASTIGPSECYYIVSLCGSNHVNSLDFSCFSKIASDNKLFRRAKLVSGKHVSIGHGDSRVDGGWDTIDPLQFGLEACAFGAKKA